MKRYRRSSLEVTYDRLMDLSDDPRLDGYERDALSQILQAIVDISEGNRGPKEGR